MCIRDRRCVVRSTHRDPSPPTVRPSIPSHRPLVITVIIGHLNGLGDEVEWNSYTTALLASPAEVDRVPKAEGSVQSAKCTLPTSTLPDGVLVDFFNLWRPVANEDTRILA